MFYNLRILFFTSGNVKETANNETARGDVASARNVTSGIYVTVRDDVIVRVAEHRAARAARDHQGNEGMMMTMR